LLIRTAHSFYHWIFNTLIVQFKFIESFFSIWGPPLDEFDRLTCVNFDQFKPFRDAGECIAVSATIMTFAFEVMVKDCIVVRLTDTQ